MFFHSHTSSISLFLPRKSHKYTLATHAQSHWCACVQSVRFCHCCQVAIRAPPLAATVICYHSSLSPSLHPMLSHSLSSPAARRQQCREGKLVKRGKKVLFLLLEHRVCVCVCTPVCPHDKHWQRKEPTGLRHSQSYAHLLWHTGLLSQSGTPLWNKHILYTSIHTCTHTYDNKPTWIYFVFGWKCLSPYVIIKTAPYEETNLTIFHRQHILPPVDHTRLQSYICAVVIFFVKAPSLTVSHLSTYLSLCLKLPMLS